MNYKAPLLSTLLLSISLFLYYIMTSFENKKFPPKEWWKYELTSNEYLTNINPSAIIVLEKKIEQHRRELIDIVDTRQKETVLQIITNFEARIEDLKNHSLNRPMFTNQKEGDHVYFFTSPHKDWQNLSGIQGYVLVRDGDVIDYKVTLLN